MDRSCLVHYRAASATTSKGDGSMKRTTGAAIATIVLVAVIPTFADPPAGSSWTQTFDDEFNGSTLDTAKWNPNSPWGGPANGASEGEGYYPSQITVAGGLCTIDMHKDTNTYAGHLRYWRSGILHTLHKFSQRFGYFETRVNVGSNYNEYTWPWPAVWMCPDDNGWPPEVDLYDGTGTYLFKWWTSNNYPASGGGLDKEFDITDGSKRVYESWHTLGDALDSGQCDRIL